MKAKCGCDSGFTRCPEAERLWREANNIYHSQSYDAWIKSEPYLAYREHMKGVYAEEHNQLVIGLKC